jgi:glycosyltransferase involved in cell wall biosynthesis
VRILHVSSYYHPHLGGMESTVSQVCNRLTRRGYHIALYTTLDPAWSHSFENQNGLSIRRFRVIAKPLLNPLTRGLFRAIMNSDAEIVHTHDEHAFTSNLAVAGRVLRDRPLILHCYGELAAVSRGEQLIVDLYDSTLNRASYHAADIVIQISPAFVPYVTRKFGVSGKKVRVIPNAIDPANYSSDIDPDEFRKKNSLPDGDWILYVGSLINRKGLQTLIQALPTIVREEPNTRLLVVGRGPLKPQLQDSISRENLSKHVFFLEGLSQRELSAAYKLSKLLVLPTLADVAPTVILEAMFFRRPVVSSDILGIREFFSETALLVKPRDVSMLAEKILRLLRDEELASKLGETGHRLVMKDFQWDERVDAISQIYESLV